MKRIKPTYLKCVLRSELVALMKANGIKSNYHEPALILSQALYWSERVNDVADMLEEERKREGSECLPTDCQHGWIYKSAETWIEETMLGISVMTMRRHLLALEQFGYLMSRANPKNKWDRMLQYRINIIKIMQDLESIGLILNGYSRLSMYQIDPSMYQVGISTNQVGDAILESILESNLETLKTTTSLPQNGKGAASTSQATANKKEKSVTSSSKSFALNFETDPSARLLQFFHKTKGTAMPESPNELRKQWLCVKPWYTEATNGDKADIVGIEKRVQEAIRKVLALFKKEGWTDKGIYSYSDLIKAEIWKIKGQKTVTVTEDEWI